jgi:hypothetical protein
MDFSSHIAPHDAYNFIKTHFSPQLIIPELAKVIGLDESVVLLQIHYWLQKSQHVIDNSVWVYNTFEQWQEQFSYWSLSKIKRVFDSLHKTGLVISQKKKRHSGCHTKWYSIDYPKFYALLEKIKYTQPTKKSPNLPSLANKVITDPTSRMPYTEAISNIVENIVAQGSATTINQEKSALVQNGLSSGQNEPIITKTNLTDNNKSMSNEFYRKKQWLQTLGSTRQTENFSFSKEDMEVSDQLMKIWSSVFIHEEKKPLLHDKRRAKLLKVFGRDFSNNFEEWREFCILINSSRFLMGEKKEGFKAHFDWLLEEKTIEKIRGGEFDIGDRIPDIEQQRHAEEQAKAEVIAVAKLTALQVEKQQVEREAEIKRLAAKLEWSALEAIENSWSAKEIEQAKQEFEQYLFAAEDEYGLHHYRDIFNQGRWQEPMINFAFTSFKRQRYVTKNSHAFILEATEKYYKP